ncbi:MAG: choice-of-anchor J domain-containing protein [Candidatus Delongbacteria bacterium]|nr:choice-of-anchor J domain-containing protein [Candidatus Delongbacteria bacterium]MBN2834427.1 choice-of-anchor J domain-containing protein [Candidatus Delongbacteria bacterium]
MKILLMIFFISSALFSQVILNESFETGNSDGNPPVGWAVEIDTWKAGFQGQSHNRSAYTGDWYVYLNWQQDSWFYKEVELESGKIYDFSAMYKCDGSIGFEFKIIISSDTNPNSIVTELFYLNPVTNTDYLEAVNEFQVTESGTYYLGIYGKSDITPWYLCLDDIKINERVEYHFNLASPLVYQEIETGENFEYTISIENIGSLDDSYSFSFSGNNWDYQVTDFENNPISSISINTLEMDSVKVIGTVGEVPTGTMDNLTFTVISSSSTSESIEFSTKAIAPVEVFPLIEDFESTQFPLLGWRNISETAPYTRVTIGDNPVCYPHDNSSGMIRYNSFSQQDGHSAILVTPKLHMTDDQYTIRFWMYRTDNISNRTDKIEVYCNNNPTDVGGELLGTIHRAINFEPVEEENNWYEYSFTITDFNEYSYVIFKAVSNYGWNMYLDDISIEDNAPDLDAPEFISISGTHNYIDNDLNLELIIRDNSETIDPIHGFYNVGNGNVEVLFQKDRADYNYSGIIPAQALNTIGTLEIELEDIHGNSCVIGDIEISWNGVQPLLEESFEGDFPPEGWEVDGSATTWLYWQSCAEMEYTDSDGNVFIVTPTDGERQAVVEWDFQNNPQNEKLISKPVFLPENSTLSFDTHVKLNSMDYDNFTVEICSNGGAYETLWNAFYLTGNNYYDYPVELSLAQYTGTTVRIMWHAYNTQYDNFWYSWFLDNVKIVKDSTIFVNEDNTPDKTTLYQNYPNPFNPVTSISFYNHDYNNLQLIIYNNNGELVDRFDAHKIKNEINRIEYDGSKLSSGVYFYSLLSDGKVIDSKKMILLK